MYSLRLAAPDAGDVYFLIHREQIRVAPVTLTDDDLLLVSGIDLGEAEAIALARQQQADWVLMDNAHARTAAKITLFTVIPNEVRNLRLAEARDSSSLRSSE